jgi:hypothetical protein
MEPEGSLLNSQESASNRNPEPHNSNPRQNPISLDVFNIIFLYETFQVASSL